MGGSNGDVDISKNFSQVNKIYFLTFSSLGKKFSAFHIWPSLSRRGKWQTQIALSQKLEFASMQMGFSACGLWYISWTVRGHCLLQGLIHSTKPSTRNQPSTFGLIFKVKKELFCGLVDEYIQYVLMCRMCLKNVCFFFFGNLKSFIPQTVWQEQFKRYSECFHFENLGWPQSLNFLLNETNSKDQTAEAQMQTQTQKVITLERKSCNTTLQH